MVAADELNPEITYPTEEQKAQYQTLSPLDKKLMLEKLDLIRFIINTPEFETNFMKATFYGDANVSGLGGNMELGKPPWTIKDTLKSYENVPIMLKFVKDSSI